MANNDLKTELGGSEKMRITSAGNVGIGTTSPNAKLHLVSGTGVPYSLRLNSDATGTWQLGVGSTGYYDGSFLLQDASVGDRLRIDTSGTFTLPAYNSTNKTGTPTYLLGTDASGNIVKTNTVPGSSAGPYLPLSAGSGEGLTGQLWFTGTTDANRKIFFTNAGTYAKGSMDAASYGFQVSGSEKLTILPSGNVGIGTTNPGAKLQLGDYPNDNIDVTTYPNVPSEHMIHLTAPETTNRYGGGISFGENAFTAANITVQDAGGGGSLNMLFGTRHTSGTVQERMRITSAGNVGIGITAPSTKLDVAGNANISDTLAIGSLSTVPTASLGRALNIQVLANSSGTTVAQWLDIDRTITTDSTSAATWGMVLRNASTTTSTANDGKIYGAQIIGRHQGTGGIESAMGVRSTADINTTGTITTTGTLWGSYNEAQVTNGSVTFANSGIFGSASRGQVLGSGTVNITSQGVVGGALIGVLNNVNASVNRVVGGEFELDLQNGTTDKAHVVSLNTFNIVSPTNLSIDEFAYIYLGEDVAIPTTITDNAYFIKSLTSLPSELAGSIEATSFIKTGGTSSQFLKADGSIDSTSYAPATGGSYLPLTGGTMTGNLTITKSSATMKVSEAGGGDIRMVAGGATGYMGTYNNTSMQIMQNGSNAIFIDTSRNVGIGTTSPSTTLQLSKANTEVLANNPAWPAGILEITDTSAYNAGTGATIVFKKKRDSAGNQVTVGAIAGEGLGGNSQLSFWTGDAAYMGTAPKMVIRNTGNVGIGTTNPAKQLQVRGDAPWIRIEEDSASSKRLDLWVDPSSAIAYVGANQSAQQLSFQTASSDRIRILNNGNVGIGTTSPGYKLSVSGGIEAGGKITYSKSAASLDTTGYAVAGLLASFNGASACFTFTCFGHTGGYQKIVYSCYNSGGNWYTSKAIDEGTNDFDVAASASGSTITFTFKSTSGTKSYTPRVTVETSGSAINSTYA